MTFCRRPNPFNTLDHDKNGRGESGSHIVHDFLETNYRTGSRILEPPPPPLMTFFQSQFIDFIEIVQTQIIVDCFGGQHTREKLGQRLHPVDRPITTNTENSVHFQRVKALFDFGHDRHLAGINVSA